MSNLFSSIAHLHILLISATIFSFFLSLQASPSSSLSSSPYKATQQLISFKSALPTTDILRTWVPTQNPCFFERVACRENRISSIDLSFIHLSTDFSPVASFLMPIDGLETLSLQSANISGSISGFKCSATLSSLDLSGNSLSGSLSTLSNLGSCSNLKFLNLSTNSLDFSGKIVGGFKLNSLESLDLSFNLILGQNVVSWILAGGCRELKLLGLRGNKITGNIDVSGCSNLEFLDVSSNNFTTNLPSLGDCSVLQHLDISGNKFSGDISETVFPCKELRFLNLSSNGFTGPIPSFPLDNMQFLYLAENSFDGEIPQSLAGACATLAELDLSANHLSVDSGDKPLCFCDLVLGMERLRRSLPPGLDEAFPYQTIPRMAMIIPNTTCRLRPSLPKNVNPNTRTRIVFMWPSTWKDTAVNRPMQMNWLRFVPTAILQESTKKNCKGAK